MCGIGLLASFPASAAADIETTDALLPDWNQRISITLASRGPDVPCRQCHFGPSNINDVENNKDAAAGPAPAAGTPWSVTLHASVLHMRGQHPAAQPAVFPMSSTSNYDQNNVQNSALCWNGECYTYEKMQEESDGCISTAECKQNHVRHGAMAELISTTTAEDISDTVLVTNLLQKAIAQSQHSGMGEHEAIATAMSRIHGEYSFILFVPSFSSSKAESRCSSSQNPNENNDDCIKSKKECYQSRHGCFYYGRDWLGRRSLLINKSLPGVMALSSVAIDGSNPDYKTWLEIPPGVVYKVDANTGKETSLSILKVVNRDTIAMAMPSIEPREKGPPNGTVDQSIIDGMAQASSQKDTDDAAKCLLKLLDRAVKRRVMQAPPPKSQSVNDASVAVLFSGGIDSVVLAALSHRHIPSNQSIDLLNVSFYNDADLGSSARPNSPDRLAAILSYHEMLRQYPGRKWRFIAVDVPYQEVLDLEGHVRRLISPLDSTMDFNIATAFWFAGRGKGRVLGANEVAEARRGLESKAGMSNKKTSTSSGEPLLRFANGDKTKNGTGSSTNRQTCIRDGCARVALSGCVFQACKFCCGKLQGPISSYLGRSARLCPAHNGNNATTKKSSKAKSKTNVVEDVGRSTSANGCKDEYCTVTSSAKILLSGVGADEQMAGYGRHRTTHQRGGYEALHAELKTEVNRLWTRNLGRDDRCLSDHGKEGRYPYLDEDVMSYLEEVPLEEKCDMSRPPGEGDKLILRKVARMIGVVECSTLVKRAIQFGSRIAKVSDKNRFGSSRKAMGQSKIVADMNLLE